MAKYVPNEMFNNNNEDSEESSLFNDGYSHGCSSKESPKESSVLSFPKISN